MSARGRGGLGDRSVWITWEYQRRNRELADALGCPLYEWGDIDAIPKGARKYATGGLRTLRLLLRRRPRIVFCQNPSLVLAWMLARLRPLFRYVLVVDAHNAGLFPLEGRSRALSRLAREVQARADLTLVSNEALAEVVQANGGRPFVLPDRLPTLPGAEVPPAASPGDPRRVLFICSYAADEPYAAVFEAARILGPAYRFQVTGNPDKVSLDRAALPPNVELTGFLPEQAYVALLRAADVAIDLTTRPDCLVCGAYEALSAGRPAVLSDTPALRAYFAGAAVFSGHAPAQLAAAVAEAAARGEEIAAGLPALRERLRADWEGRLARLRQGLENAL